MLTTNLLPPEEKKSIRLEEARRISVFFGIAVSAALLAGAVFLLPSFLTFLLEKRELARVLKFEQSASSALDITQELSKINKARENIKLIEDRGRKPQVAPLITSEIFGHAGAEVRLTSLNVKRSGEVRISGIAGRRSDMLGFEKKLRDSGKFREISSPIANIIRETNINFNISAQLK